MTNFGRLVGGFTYDALAAKAIAVELFGHQCRCASLDDLIRAKRAAGRPKDLEALAELEAIREEDRF